MGRAVSDGIDIGQRSAALAIDQHAVATFRARRAQRLHARDDADADDHQIGRQHCAVGHLHAGNLAAFTHQAIDRDPGAQIDAVRAVVGFIERRERFTRHARQHARKGFEQGDVAIELGQNGRRLEPDIAAADHHSALRAGIELAHQPVDVFAGADGMDA